MQEPEAAASAVEPPQDAPPASPVAGQLRAGFRWLRFSGDLEPAYRLDQYQAWLLYLRVNLATALLLVVAFSQLDRLVMHIGSQPVMDLVRFVALIPAIALALAVTFLRDGDRWYGRATAVLAPVAMVAIAALVIIGWMHGEHRLFTALILATIFIYFLIGLSFFSAIAANLVALAAYVQGARMALVPPAEFVYNVTMLVFANLVGAAMAYNVEHMRRKSWLESKLLAELADRDGLTGIANRRRFDEHLARLWHQAVREHRPLALLLADLDFFKAYNDRYGHQAGDEAMKQVATVLSRAALRPLDLAARYGGEEFAVLLYDATQDHAARVAEQILEAIRRLGIPHAGSTCAPVLTTSVGVAWVVPMAGRSCAGLVQLADQALYAAKDGGRNQSRLLQAEYEHMQTGYFRRHAAEAGTL